MSLEKFREWKLVFSCIFRTKYANEHEINLDINSGRNPAKFNNLKYVDGIESFSIDRFFRTRHRVTFDIFVAFGHV